MENITVKDIIEATGGKLLCGDENKVIRDFSIDSRTGTEDSIFVPIIGERVDAHRFIDSALDLNGATFTQEHDQADSDKPWIRVDNTLEAMQKVGTYYRNRLNLPVVAVTGSVGKTTTREMIACALSSGLKIFQTRGNQNSQVGVPLTLAHITPEDQAAVLEIGMSERGQIEKLTTMIRPDIAVVTVIGVSHIAQLKTQENICLEKMDILKGLPENGKVFLNGDDPFLAPYRGRLPFDTYFYGLDEACDYRADHIVTGDGGTSFVFHYEDQELPVSLEVLGDHYVRNALVALGVAHQMNLDLEAAAAELKHFHGQRQRMIKAKACQVIDDTYNASPDSMRASLRVLSTMDGIKGRRIAVLADMLELGEQEKEYHYQIGEYIAGQNIQEVYAYGDLSLEILKGIAEHNGKIRTGHFPDRESLTAFLLDYVKKEDIVLLKGSNGMKLSEVSQAIQNKE
ncbi:MAG: UDP-N-acetylmuramoyl-tripeptide--D-alanyl-D-alanine ligase [Eubacterium sp.]|nr:UDP-N-acetylmuramoyl-tripeptide--D-alanyl-D-alanine ligase [Eubacterium sp.]